MDLRKGQIILTGVESSGKSTLSAMLAKHTGWAHVKEFARYDPKVIAGQHELADLKRLLNEQQATTDDHRKTGPVICDTGALVLSIWSEVRFGQPLQGARRIAESASIYLLLAPDIPWEPDPLRASPNKQEREGLHARYVQRLTEWNLPHAVIRGNALEGRFHQAIGALKVRGFDISE